MALNNQLIEIWKKSVDIFVEDVLSAHLTCVIPKFHREIYSMVSDNDRVVLAAPRGFAKSHIVSFFYVLHSALFERYKDICIISASESLAIEMLRKIKLEIESNPLIYGLFGKLDSNKWTENHIILNNNAKVNIRAKGAGAQIRGFRPDLIILDDIETDETATSEEQLNKLRDWILRACINTLTRDGKFCMIGTILNQNCILNEFLHSDKGWVTKIYKAYNDSVQEPGHELWPELWDHDKLQKRKKEIGSFAFYTEFMNDPVSDESAPIKMSHIKYWTELPADISCVISVDPAYSEDVRSDYKVVSLVGIDGRYNRYLISYIRTHCPSGEFMDAILNLYLQNKNRCTGVGIPCQGVEREFYNSVLEKARTRNIYAPFIELKNTFLSGAQQVIRKKSKRIIASLQPLFEAGKYYIHPSHTEALDELLTIGNSRWDDLVDTLAYAEQILVSGYPAVSNDLDGYNNDIITEPLYNYYSY